MLKSFLYFMENGNPEKFLIFSQKKVFFIFLDMKPRTFQPKLEKRKFVIFYETETRKKFLISSQKKLFLYFRKPNPRKNSLYFTKRNFLIFREMELSSHKIKNLFTFQEELPKPQKPKFLIFLQKKL